MCDTDTRVWCSTCTHIRGTDTCAARGARLMTDMPVRCLEYLPRPGVADQRSGTQRWPWLAESATPIPTTHSPRRRARQGGS